MKNKLKYRMYFFVPYNLSPIQQAIQAGHAALEYANKFNLTPEFKDFITNDKTWIILNGGTTNAGTDENNVPIGSLNQIREQLLCNKISISCFYEPDLNNALTAVCFLADERVWDHETYEDFMQYLKRTNANELFYHLMLEEIIEDVYADDYKIWEKNIGGKQNIFLRNLIAGKKLA